jgi:hypothetical protein
MCLARNGPKVKIPQIPITADGIPASTSRKRPITAASRGGSFSTRITAAPTANGKPTSSAIAEDCNVPAISGHAPNFEPGRW